MTATIHPIADKTPDEPTPIPELFDQIQAEGGLVPWLSARACAARLAAYDAALERRAAQTGLAASSYGPRLRLVR